MAMVGNFYFSFSSINMGISSILEMASYIGQILLLLINFDGTCTLIPP
jgi:hypothetical protein